MATGRVGTQARSHDVPRWIAMRLSPLLLVTTLFFGGLAAHAQFSLCPNPIAGYPFSATLVISHDDPKRPAHDETMPVARNAAGSILCGVPQTNRVDPIDIIDVERGQDIFLECGRTLTDPRQGKYDACEGQRVQVQARARFTVQHVSDGEVQRRFADLASTPPSTRTEGYLTMTRRVIGQRSIHGVLCVGFSEVRQGTEPQLVGEKVVATQRVDRESEDWVSAVYGTIESSSCDRLRSTCTHIALRDFRLGDPPPELLQVPPAFAETYRKAVLASPQPVTVFPPTP